MSALPFRQEFFHHQVFVPPDRPGNVHGGRVDGVLRRLKIMSPGPWQALSKTIPNPGKGFSPCQVPLHPPAEIPVGFDKHGAMVVIPSAYDMRTDFAFGNIPDASIDDHGITLGEGNIVSGRGGQIDVHEQRIGRFKILRSPQDDDIDSLLLP